MKSPMHDEPPAGLDRGRQRRPVCAGLASALSLLLLAGACDSGSTKPEPGDVNLDSTKDGDLPKDGGADFDVRDAEAQDGAPPDSGPVADLGPYERYYEQGIFQNVPSPVCEVRRNPEERTAGFEEVPFPTEGRLVFAGDVDRNGRAELFVRDFNIDPPLEGRSLGLTIYEWANDAWTAIGRARSIKPYGFFDLDGDGRFEVVGSEGYRNREGPEGAFGSTLGVRRDEPDSEWRYDESVYRYLEEVTPGRLGSTLGNHDDGRPADVDGDGRPEILLGQLGRIDEWDGSTFVTTLAHHDPVFTEPGFGDGLAVSGDFDGDGQREVVFGAKGPPMTLPESGLEFHHHHYRIFEARGDDTFVETARLAMGLRSANTAAVGDITGDGIDDLLLGAGFSGCARFQLWTTAGDDRFQLLWEQDVDVDGGAAGTANRAAFGDVDGDGDMEAVLSMNNYLTVWDWRQGQLVQIYGERVARPEAPWSTVWAADIDGDGADEIMTWDGLGAADAGNPGPGNEYKNPRGVLVRRKLP